MKLGELLTPANLLRTYKYLAHQAALVDVDTLLRLLGPSRVGGVEKYGGFILIKPPASEAVIRVEREKLAFFSSELSWSFTAVIDAEVRCKALAVARVKGLLKRRLEWEVKCDECGKFEETLKEVLGDEGTRLTLKAKPDVIEVKVNGGIHVKVSKVLIELDASSLKLCYDLSLRVCTSLAERLIKR